MREPGFDEGVVDEGSIVKLVHIAGVVPDCVTENVRPPIVTLALREAVDGFESHDTLVDPGAFPLAGETLSHELSSDVVHAPPTHSAGEEPVIVTDREPKPDPGLAELGLIVKDEHAGGAPEAVRNVSPLPTGAHPAAFLAHARNWYIVFDARSVGV